MADAQRGKKPDQPVVRDGKPAWAQRFQDKLDGFERPEKLTKDDILASWDSAYESRQAAVSILKKPSTLAKIVTGVSLVAAVWMGMSTSSAGGGFDKSSQANTAEIASLKSNLAQAQAESAKVPSQKNSVSLVVDANRRGKAIADIQNKMIKESKHPNADTMASYSKQLVPYMDQGVMSATGQWYYITPDSSNPYHTTDYRWTAETPYEFNDDASSIRVTWLCRDVKSGDVLAWAQGDYQASTKKFQGVAWGSTIEGSKRVGTPVDNDGSEAKNPNNTSTSKAG